MNKNVNYMVKGREFVEVDFGLGKLRIYVYRSNIVRVTHIPYGGSVEDSFVIISRPMLYGYSIDDREGCIEVCTDEVCVYIDRHRNSIDFETRDVKLSEVDRKAVDLKNYGEALYSFEHTFVIDVDEALYGLGQHAGYSSHSGFNYRNRTVYLAQRNTDIAVPFMVSSKGYGILWDMYSMGVFSSRGNKLRMWFEAGKVLDYYFIYGPDIDRVIQGYRYLTGKAPLLPRYALGYWQSKERYASQEEIVSVVKMFRDRGIPIDIIVQDWRYWGKYGWNAFKFDEEYYPDPKKMIEEIHSMGVRLAISIWPIFEKNTDIYKEIKEIGCIMAGGDRDFGLLNVFNEKCREWFWKKIEESFFSIGVDGWWLDASEPEVKPLLIYTTWQKDLDTGKGKMIKYLNLYPLLESKAVYEGQRKVSNKRVVILTRSGFAGIQRYGVINWSGDVTGDWTTFRSQIQAGLNYSISGLPYWTTDIGGFFSGNPDTEGYRELFIRWFQFGVFNPIFRVHGTYYPKEPWRFGEEVEKILTKFIKLRYRLLPYIYTLMWKVYSEDYTIIRPLVMDFREDPEVLDIDDQYMFGPYIMVSPITTPSTYEREVYIPKGLWYDFWSGEKFYGGKYIRVEAPLDRIPLHIRAGSLIPMASPGIKNSMEEVNEIELRVYRGRDSEFYIYIDDGETYRYELGEYTLIPLKWSEEESKLIIDNKVGKYSINDIVFKIVIVDRERGGGIEEAQPDTEVIYRGDKIIIELKNNKS